MLGKVLDHVVALGFTVHQHIQAQALLHLHGMADLAVHGVGVVVGREFALLVGLTRQADRRGLRERTDGGGRERRQLQALTLGFDTLGEGRLALAVGSGHGGQAGLNLRLVNAW
ncbi:hypothetical protein D3C80_919950 [compost metagenome]